MLIHTFASRFGWAFLRTWFACSSSSALVKLAMYKKPPSSTTETGFGILVGSDVVKWSTEHGILFGEVLSLCREGNIPQHPLRHF